MAIAYCNRIRGDKANSIEQAIKYYNQALEVYTHPGFPVDWARIQNNLSTAYCTRIRGDRTENIEKAIEYCNKALEVRTEMDFPVDWAMTQNNLAIAYSERIKGDKAENIEKAIEYFNKALEVRTEMDFPVEWAMIQNNLAIAYFERIIDDKANNIEQAINHYNQALEVYTHPGFPVDWARIQNNLSTAYCTRIRGDRTENIEKAIEYCNKALEVRTEMDFPVDWSMTQNNLAIAYSERIMGDKAENIEKAIEYCNKALEVYTYYAFPVDWATTQNNIAGAYHDRIRGDRAENIEKAIEHYNYALKIYTHQNFPVQWATTQNNLGVAYSDRIKGHRAYNIEKAIKLYKRSLEIRTKEDFPVQWAETQNNLAIAYSERICGDRASNIEEAISHYLNSLQISNIESMPNDFRRICRLLGDLYIDIGRWMEAIKSYKYAIKAGDFIYRSGLSSESKIVDVKDNTLICRNASLAACRMGLVTEALLILEKGKTRLLSEALRFKMKQPEGVPNEEWIKYEQAAEKYRTATKPLDRKENYAQREKEVQKLLEELEVAVKVVQRYNPDFQNELDILDILSIPDEETALLTFCITDKGSIGFVVSKLNGIQSVDIPDFKTMDLNNMLFNVDEQKPKSYGLVDEYRSYLNALNNYQDGTYETYKYLENKFHAWQRTLNNVLSNIGSRLFYPLLANLSPQIKRLILLPSGGLFLLPLNAVPLYYDQLLCQRYCVSYAPSIPLFREMQKKARTMRGKGLYAVINPQEDPSLVFSRYEGQEISKLFQSYQVNMGETGTKATVLDGIPERAYLHFSCHGNYNWNDPSQSGLYLAGGRTLSLADLQNDIVDMSSARLVTLSACETGITDILKGSADEFVGLPAGFMLAGVPCVVSSLWSVPDISTAMLMERLYSNHIAGGMDIPMALQDAQLWVRELTAKQVADYVEKCYQSEKWKGESKENIEQYRERYLKMAEKSPEEKPFQHPYYWAAFTVNGA